MYMSQSLFYLKIALHVSGVTITHLQEHIKFKNYIILQASTTFII
jgi:hypothetical protein